MLSATQLSATQRDCLKQAGFWWALLVQASLEGDRKKMREASYWLAYSSSKIADEIAEADDEDAARARRA